MVQGIREFLSITPKREKIRATICAAIRARRVIEFYYHDGYRTAEPYALGVTMQGDADNESLICYQTGGHSDLNKAAGWKLYRASEMEEIIIKKEPFTGDRPGYDPDDIDMVKVFCSVRPEQPAMNKPTEMPQPLKVEPPNIEPRPVLAAVEKQSPIYLTHNELMRQFRLTHPLAVSEPGHLAQRLPERSEWGNRHFNRGVRERYLMGQSA